MNTLDWVAVKLGNLEKIDTSPPEIYTPTRQE